MLQVGGIASDKFIFDDVGMWFTVFCKCVVTQNIDLKLVDVPELNYFSTNKPHPQGTSVCADFKKRDFFVLKYCPVLV